MFSKAVLRQLIKHSNIWEAPKSKYLDFTSIPFHAVRVCCENSLQWREFESAWKQILVPTGTFKDIFKWSGNVRAQSLLRRMYLQHAYGSTEIFNSAVNKGYSDPLVFPSRDEVVDHFDMGDWSRCSDDEGGEDIQKNMLITSLQDENDPAVANWSLENILEAAGCCVYGRNEFNQFCEKFEFYEFLTSTYLDGLASYIQLRAHESLEQKKRSGVDGSNGRHYTVLEVGAGSGRLSYYLKNKLQKDKNIFMVATDHGTYQWTIKLCTARSIPNTHYTHTLYVHAPAIFFLPTFINLLYTLQVSGN